jgi:hypothetical protein
MQKILYLCKQKLNMVALLETSNTKVQEALAAFISANGIKAAWFENLDELEEKEDTALYELMVAEPRELVDTDEFLQTLKSNINAGRNH